MVQTPIVSLEWGLPGTTYSGGTAQTSTCTSSTPDYISAGNGCPATEVNAEQVYGLSMDSSGDLSSPKSMAVDSSGNIWLANSGNNSVTELSNTGAAISPSGGYTANSTLNEPSSISVDASGNVWVANEGNDSLTEIMPSGGTTNFTCAEVTNSPLGIIVSPTQ